MTTQVKETWRLIQRELRRAVSVDLYEMWLAPLRPLEVHGANVTVEAPRELHGWVTSRFARVLQASAELVLGPGATVDVRGAATGDDPRSQPPDSAAAASDDDLDVLNPKYTFEQFVIGDANRFAHAAALAVAELPGQTYNPLFIYGPPGVGKTHLLHSIGNYVRACGGGLSVRYTTIETFTNQFIAALGGGTVGRFKGRYRHNDVLLIDDVQFLASKAKTEEEFFHTFNALYETGSQLVLTCDRLPRDLDAVEDRLRERFEAGLVTAVHPPDFATRLTVLRKRIQHDGIALDDEGILHVVAERVPTNVRALEGALIRVVAFASLTHRPLTPDLAAEVLGELHPPPPHGAEAVPVTVGDVQAVTAEAFGLSVADLLSHSRRSSVAWPRQIAMYLARAQTGETLPAIAARFGRRNHTTVLHACRRTEERLAADPEIWEVVRRLTERLAGDGDDRRG